MQNEEEIRRLMQTGMDADETPSRALSAVSRARRQIGHRDTLSFALVKVWAVLARLLAPFFAAIGERQAAALHQSGSAAKATTTNTNQNQGESND